MEAIPHIMKIVWLKCQNFLKMELLMEMSFIIMIMEN